MRQLVIALALLFGVVSCANHVIKKEVDPLSSNSEHNDVFQDLMSRGVLRPEVELISALGANYKDTTLTADPSLIQSVKRSLEDQGRFLQSPYGNKVYRVRKVEEAETILRGMWPDSLFNTKLKTHFKQYPNATLAIMEGDDQRIFFFDRKDRFVASYPK